MTLKMTSNQQMKEELENLSAKLKVLENHFVTLTSELEDKERRLTIMEAKLKKINFKETKLHEFPKCEKCDFGRCSTSNLHKHMSDDH